MDRNRLGDGGRRLVALLAVLALVAVACGDDDDSGSGSEDAFTIGFPLDAGGESADTSEYRVAGAATAAYVNEELDGIGGRPLEIMFCETEYSAARATECVNEFVQAGVSAILVGAIGFGEQIASASLDAGIPYVAYLGATLTELTAPGAFALSGAAVTILLAPALTMIEEGLQKLAIVAIDVPTATQGVELLATPSYQAAGLDLQLVAVPPDTADMSANVSTAADADTWLVLGDAAFCDRALEAIQDQAGEDAPIFVSLQCVRPENASNLPNGYTGVRGVASTRLDTSDPEHELFEQVLADHASESLDGLAPGFLADGFTTVLGFTRLMEGYEGDGSPETVLDHLGTATGELPLGGGIEMACGASPVAALANLCSLAGWATEFDADGQAVSFTEVDPRPLLGG